MKKPIAGLFLATLIAGLSVPLDLPASAQSVHVRRSGHFSSRYHRPLTYYRSDMRNAAGSATYEAQNEDLMQRIARAYDRGLISETEASSMQDAVAQQAQNYQVMRTSDGFLSVDELTALNTILNRTSASLDNLISGRQPTRSFSYRRDFWR